MPDSSFTLLFNRLPHRQWQATLRGLSAPVAYQQDGCYAAAAAQLGARVEQIAVVRTDARGNVSRAQPVALIQLHVKTFFKLYHVATIMRGPIWCENISDEEKISISRLLKSEIKALLPWPKAVLFMPEYEDATWMKLAGFRRIMTPYHTVLLDLSQSEEQLLAAMDGKWRNRLRAAQKRPDAELRIHISGKRPKLSQYLWLLEKEAEQSAQKSYAAITPALVPAFQEADEKGQNLLYCHATEGTQGEPLGAMLFLLHGATATYHIGWANETGKQMNLHNRLLWEAIGALKKRGITWLDLGGITTSDSPGLARFKLGTGGQPHSLAGTFM